jgi:hypothetical protein
MYRYYAGGCLRGDPTSRFSTEQCLVLRPFAPVECCWPEALVPSSPCAAEPLELGSAMATAPPAPISRPAASTQTPAAKRKRNRPTTISSPPANGPIANEPPFATLSRASRRLWRLAFLRVGRKCGAARQHVCRRGLQGWVQMRGPFIAVPTCQCHQGGRHKLTLRRASGLKRLAAPRPGCGSNVSDVSSELVGATDPDKRGSRTIGPPSVGI